MKKKSYILINSLISGGAERVVSSIVKNDDFQLIQIWGDSFYNTGENKPEVLIPKKRFLIFDLILASINLYKIIKKNKIETVNSHLFWSNYINVFVSFFSKHKTVCTHCVSFRSKFKDKKTHYLIHSFMMKKLLKYSKYHTYKSQSLKIEYEDSFKLSKGKVIYNPIDQDWILSQSKKPIDYIFSNDKIYLLVVGRFHSSKNQKLIIESIPKLPNNTHFIFLGIGDILPCCRKLSRQLNIENRVDFLGEVENPYPFYFNSHCYLSASNSEGFPNALLEALALNCYPIHSDCFSGPREIISNLSQYMPKEKSNDKFFEVFPLGIIFASDSRALVASVDYFINDKPFIDKLIADSLFEKLNSSFIVEEYRCLSNIDDSF